MATSARSKAKADVPALDVEKLAERFMIRFRGLERFHGYSIPVGTPEPGEKQETETDGKHEPVTVDLWVRHLFGTYGVGQTPIRDDSTCVFGAIDIDVYDGLDLVALATQIDVLRLPLVVIRSKSGGAQCYAFFSEPVKADLLMGKLMEWQIALGYPKSEVFPKQTRLASRADYGSWLNMPYFGCLTAEGTNRYAVVQSGDQLLDPRAFLDHAEAKAITVDQLKAIAAPIKDEHRDLLLDAPPCLQALAVVGGIGRGSRNNGLYNLGVYLKKRFPDDWEQRVDVYNPKFLEPALGTKEVASVVKSLGKKDGYFYRCRDDPIVHACNKQICYTRKFGIGQGSDDPGVALGPLLKIDNGPGVPPVWLWDVNGKRVQLTTPEMMQQPLFIRRCVEEVNVMPTPVRPGKWAEIVRQKLGEMTVIEAPPEVTRPGMIRSYLEQYLTRSPKFGKDFAELVTKKLPVIRGDRVWFQVEEFSLWLQREMKFVIERHELYRVLRDFGLEGKPQRCGKAVKQLWSIPVFTGLFDGDAPDAPAGESEDDI